jgi:hypothetical protein
MSLLKPRDRSSKSDEARWNVIYKICFPDDEITPSPCGYPLSLDITELIFDEIMSIILGKSLISGGKSWEYYKKQRSREATSISIRSDSKWRNLSMRSGSRQLLVGLHRKHLVFLPRRRAIHPEAGSHKS